MFIKDDYYNLPNESNFNIKCMLNLENYNEDVSSDLFDKWIKIINNEILSMDHHDVWELVKLPNGFKPFRCKWVFKNKKDSKGKVEFFKQD